MTKSVRYAYRPDHATPPGATLAETLEHLGMTQTEFARRTGLSPKHVSEIVNGKAPLTPETAILLERVLGAPARLWNRLEANYRETLARIRADDELAAQTEHLRHIPYARLQDLGYLPDADTPAERLAAVLGLLGVGGIRQVAELCAGAYRIAPRRPPDAFALAVWLRLGEVQVAAESVCALDVAALENALPRLRELTTCPVGFVEELRALLAAAGVALALVPHLDKTYVQGATRWRRDGTALVQVSNRYRWADIFWFSLLHELGHAVLGHREKDPLIHWQEPQREAEAEREASAFAADALLPPDQYAQITSVSRYSEAYVRAVAAEVGVCPGIVVGRLQHEGLIAHSRFNSLRRQVDIRLPRVGPARAQEPWA